MPPTYICPPRIQHHDHIHSHTIPLKLMGNFKRQITNETVPQQHAGTRNLLALNHCREWRSYVFQAQAFDRLVVSRRLKDRARKYRTNCKRRWSFIQKLCRSKHPD
jgi:hypothetical protein